MPAPAPTWIKLSFITAVLIAIAVSIFPFHEIYPIAPPYIPLEPVSYTHLTLPTSDLV